MSELRQSKSGKMSRRELLKAMSMGAAGLALSACTTPAQPTKAGPAATAVPAGPVELIFHGRTGTQGDFFTKMAEAFGASTGGKITVKPELTPGADYDTKLATLVAGGQLGDAYHTFPFGSMYPFASKGVAMALDSMIAADKAWDPNNFFPVAVELTKWNGKTFAVPIGIHAGWSGWMINLDMWSKAGCATPKWEWEYEKDWITNVVKMQEYLNKQTDKKRYAYRFEYNAQNALLFLMSFGGNWIEPVERKKAMVDNENSVKGLQFMRDLVTKHKTTPARKDIVGNDIENQLVASITNGIFSIGTYKNTAKDFKWQFYPAPSGPNGGRGTFVGIDYFCMNAKTKNAQAVMDWFKFFILNKDNAKAMLGAGFSPSAVKENWNTSPLSDDPNYTQAKQWLDIAKGWALPHNARVSEFNQAFASGLEGLMNEANDFKTEIANLQKKVQAVLDQPPS
jgi:multiple sugar transport system substrate-binding protein